MKYVVPDMAQVFLELLNLQGESEPIFERDKNNRKVIARRSYNLYSDYTEKAKMLWWKFLCRLAKIFQV